MSFPWANYSVGFLYMFLFLSLISKMNDQSSAILSPRPEGISCLTDCPNEFLLNGNVKQLFLREFRFIIDYPEKLPLRGNRKQPLHRTSAQPLNRRMELLSAELDMRLLLLVRNIQKEEKGRKLASPTIWQPRSSNSANFSCTIKSEKGCPNVLVPQVQ